MRATDPLDLYLAAERLKPVDWGRDNGDCMLFLLGWAERWGWRAPVKWRGTYSDEAGARARLADQGGQVAVVCDVLGPPRMGAPARRFDVSLIPFGDWFVGAICTGAMWAFRHRDRGVCLIRRDVDLVWRVTGP